MAEEAKKGRKKKSSRTLTKALATVFGAILAPVLVAVIVKWTDLNLWQTAPPTQPAPTQDTSQAGSPTQPAPPKKLAPATTAGAANAGFVPLFNGKDLTGWTRQGTSATTWTVADGLLSGRNKLPFGKNNPNTAATVGTIITDRTDYANFHLRGEFEIRRGTFIQFRGCSDFHPGGKVACRIPVDAPGTLHVFPGDGGEPTVLGPATDLQLKPGDWVRLEVIARGPRIEVLNNGTKVVDYDNAQNTLPSGPISLTCLRATSLQIRNLEIKELNP